MAEALDAIVDCAVTGRCPQLQVLGGAVQRGMASLPGFSPPAPASRPSGWLEYLTSPFPGSDAATTIPVLPITVVVSVLCCILGFVASRILLLRYSESPTDHPAQLEAQQDELEGAAPAIASTPAVPVSRDMQGLAPADTVQQEQPGPAASAAAAAALTGPAASGRVLEMLKAADQALQEHQHLERSSIPATPSTPTAQTPVVPPRGIAGSEDEVSVASTASTVPTAENWPAAPASMHLSVPTVRALPE